MKITFLSTVHGHTWPGSELLWAGAAAELLRQNGTISAIVSEDFRSASALKTFVHQGLQVRHFSPESTRWKRLKNRFISPFSAAAGSDLIVVSCGSAFDPVFTPALARFLRNTSTPFLLICHFNAESFWIGGALRSEMTHLYEKASGVVFVSPENQRLTERQLARRIPHATLIRPPLRCRFDAPLPWPEPAGDGPWRFACPARLETQWKGQDVLLETLAQPVWKDRSWHLDLHGEGPERAYLEQLIRLYGLQDRVSFAGFTESLETLWKNHHLLVLATRGEGGPMVVTEAMMCGRISVTTRCGHIPEYVTHGKTGFLADTASPDSFGRALEEAWDQRFSWREMGAAAHAGIVTRPSHDPSAQLTRLILDTLNTSR